MARFEAKIKTITPIHVGSGNKLSPSIDYLNDGEKLYLLNHSKLLGLLGEKRFDYLVSMMIGDKPSTEILKYLKSSGKIEDFASRVVHWNRPSRKEKELHEQIHTGSGIPFLPGSSLKGAIRTLLLRDQILNDDDLLDNAKRNTVQSVFAKNYFGNDTFNDPMRFMLFGDSHFTNTATRAYFLNYLHGNVADNSWNLQKKEFMTVEAIPENEIASCILNLKEIPYGINRPYNDIDDLIGIVNWHTGKLVKFDGKMIENELNGGGDENENKAYIHQLKVVLTALKHAASNEMILRVGFGSGYRSMTGGWALDKNIVSEETVQKTIKAVQKRRAIDNGNPKFSDVVPRTRKVADDSLPFGFIKITLKEIPS